MQYYYLNKIAQPTGEHEIHTSTCAFLPSAENRIYLGLFDNCATAIREASKYYSKVDGCYFCCRSCHTR